MKKYIFFFLILLMVGLVNAVYVSEWSTVGGAGGACSAVTVNFYNGSATGTTDTYNSTSDYFSSISNGLICVGDGTSKAKCNTTLSGFTDTFNSTADITRAINNSGANLSRSISIPCSQIVFSNGIGSSGICDGSDNNGYSSLAELQTAVSNDFHNLGGSDLDTDTFNTTQQMRNAVNNTQMNITINASLILNAPWIYVDIDTFNSTADFLRYEIDTFNSTADFDRYDTDTFNSTADILRTGLNSSADMRRYDTFNSTVDFDRYDDNTFNKTTDFFVAVTNTKVCIGDGVRANCNTTLPIDTDTDTFNSTADMRRYDTFNSTADFARWNSNSSNIANALSSQFTYQYQTNMNANSSTTANSLRTGTYNYQSGTVINANSSNALSAGTYNYLASPLIINANSSSSANNLNPTATNISTSACMRLTNGAYTWSYCVNSTGGMIIRSE